MRKEYDKEFKMNAVALYRRSGKTIPVVAEEMGIAKSTFSTWVRTLSKEGADSFPGKGHLRPQDEELHALRKELHHVRMERDILKKAMAIFSAPNGKGINL